MTVDSHCLIFRAIEPLTLGRHADITFTGAYKHGSLQRHFQSLLNAQDDDPIRVVCLFGVPSSQHKLPGFGIPLAAEAMKNLGYAVAKPDRHINRAVGSFGVVCFATWKTRAGRTAPTATNDELISVMRAMKSFATTMQEPVQFMDAAVWLLCSKSGLHLTNDELCELWK